jgi:hypothetical protein
MSLRDARSERANASISAVWFQPGIANSEQSRERKLSIRDRSESRCTYDTLRYEGLHVRRYQGKTRARLKYISHVQIGIPPSLSKRQTRFCIWRFRIFSAKFLPFISRASVHERRSNQRSGNGDAKDKLRLRGTVEDGYRTWLECYNYTFVLREIAREWEGCMKDRQAIACK